MCPFCHNQWRRCHPMVPPALAGGHRFPGAYGTACGTFIVAWCGASWSIVLCFAPDWYFLSSIVCSRVDSKQCCACMSTCSSECLQVDICNLYRGRVCGNRVSLGFCKKVHSAGLLAGVSLQACCCSSCHFGHCCHIVEVVQNTQILLLSDLQVCGVCLAGVCARSVVRCLLAPIAC
jgi:hypothetical protein